MRSVRTIFSAVCVHNINPHFAPNYIIALNSFPTYSYINNKRHRQLRESLSPYRVIGQLAGGKSKSNIHV